MIGNAAFENTKLECFIAPVALQTICASAFFNCKNLKSVVLSEGVQNIGAVEQDNDHGAFEDSTLE